MRFIFLFVCLFVFHISGTASTYDSLFISELRTFIVAQFGNDLKSDFYTKWKLNENPYYCIFISKKDSIVTPIEYGNLFFLDVSDSETAYAYCRKLDSVGYSSFCYKTYANSTTRLTRSFTNYTRAAQAFIMFHELTHNYVIQHKLNIPDEFNEAIADVIGNFGAMEFALQTKLVSRKAIKNQTRVNEKIYRCFNFYINKINTNNDSSNQLKAKCAKELATILKKGDKFQHDRFGYDVNNAFLLKNSCYCWYYFLLQKILVQKKSIAEFIKILPKLQGDRVEIERYLENLQ